MPSTSPLLPIRGVVAPRVDSPRPRKVQRLHLQ